MGVIGKDGGGDGIGAVSGFMGYRHEHERYSCGGDSDNGSVLCLGRPCVYGVINVVCV